MSSPSDPRLVERCNSVAAASAIFSMAVGLSALAGWAFHIAVLKNWLPGQVSVRANAAVCFLLLGVALWNLRRPGAAPTRWPSRRLGNAAAAVVVLVALPAFLENLFGWNLGIDQLLFTVHPGDEIGSLRLGLIPPIAAFDFVLLGSALLALDRKARRSLWPSEWLALAALTADLFGVLDFALNRQAAHTRIALAGVIVFAVVPMGVVCARSEWALGGLLTSKSAGARLLRKALPAALIALGLIGSTISRALLTEAHFGWLGVAALAVISGMLLAALLAWNAYLLDRSDRERLRAEDALRISRADLELLQSRPEDTQVELRLRRRVVFGLTMAIVVTLCMGFVSWYSARESAAEADWVEHTQAVRTKISSTVKDVVDVETGARGFALAGEEVYLEAYEAGRTAIKEDLQELRRLTADDPNQQKRLDILDPQVRNAIDTAERIVRERRLSHSIPAALLRENKSCVDAVRADSTAMDEEELRLLDSRTRAMASARNVQVVLTTLFSVLGLAFLIIGGIAIHRAIDAGALARAQVKAFNSTLARRVEERTAQLHQSDQRLHGVVESAMDAIVTVDEDQRIVLFNPAAEKMFGCECSHALGQPLESLMPERFRKGHLAPVRSFMHSGETRRTMGDLGSVWGLRADGKEFPMEVSISRSEIAGRRLFTAIARDITDRQRAEYRLQESEAKYHTLFDSMCEGFCIVEMLFDENYKPVDYRFLEVSPTFEGQTGIQNAVGKTMREIAPLHEEHWFEIYGKVALTGETAHFENEAAQLHRWYDVHATRIGEPRERKVAIVFYDIATRKQAEEALRRSNTRTRFALETAKLGAWDLDAKTLQASRTLLHDQIFGYPSLLPEWSFDIFIKHVHPDDRRRVCQTFESSAAEGKRWDFECRIFRADGQMRWIWACGDHQRESSGSTSAMFGVVGDITERKLAEELLQAKEEQLRLLLEGVKDYAVYMLDPAGLISTWNAGAARIKGYRADEVLGKPLSIFYTAEEQAAGTPAHALQEALDKGRFESQGPRVRKDGSTFWAHVVILPMYGQNGQLRGFSKVLHDITQQKRDEEALRASEERFQALANGIPQLAWMAEPDGHIFWYNQRWYEYTGTTFDQMEGWAWQTVHDPVELPKVLERWKDAIASGQPFDMEFPMRGADGRFRMFLTRVMPLKDSSGRVSRWFGTNTDISERKEIEERLKESEHRYRTLFNEMAVAFVLLEVINDETGRPYDYRYLAVNSAFETQSGQSAGVVGKTVREVLPDLEPFWFETYGKVATSGESVHVERYVQAIARWVDVTAFRACEGQVGVTFSDVTKRKEAELQIRKLNDELEERVHERTSALEAANKELGAFTYSVSHDLRAPLRHISGFSKLLSEEYGSTLPPEAQHHVQRIQEGTRRMGLLVDDLLNLGRIGRQEMRLQVTDLKSVVKEVIEELAPECEGRQIDWRVGQLSFAQCDPGLLKQVFQNLIANAIKFTRPRTPAVIEVGHREADGNPIIFVRDNGVGFSMKYCDKLFGVFQRLHRTEDFEGTGVGLATVHRIIQKHGGRIWAEAALDKGATFYFTIGVSENADRKAKAVVAGEQA